MLSVAVLAACVLGGTVVARRRWQDHRAQRARRRAARELPSFVADLARSIRSGATLEVALREVAPTLDGALAAELAAVVSLLDRGHGIDRVLATWGRATRIDGTELVVAACRFSVDHGGSVEHALDGVATALLDRVEVDDEVRALSSQAGTSVVVLVVLPLAGAAVFSVVDPGFAPVLFGTTIGRLCLTTAMTLDAAGWWVGATMVRRCTAPVAVDVGSAP